MEKYNCLVVDDEPIARSIVVEYIGKLPFLQLAAESINAIGAINYLRSHEDIDILFLDIDMPNLSGIQLLKIMQPHQPVIFTTAYSEYAVESYDVNAVDYLLKPFSFERFTKAVYKAVDLIRNSSREPGHMSVENKRVLFIKSDGKSYRVAVDEILYCEAMKNYTMVILKNEQKLTPLISLSKFEQLLAQAGGDFIQVHRSFIISKKHITAVTSSHVTIAKFDIPIGEQFKERFLSAIGYTE